MRDAVLARAARLSPAARTLLEAVAVVPPHAELWLLEALAGERLDGLEECLALGHARAPTPGAWRSATSSRASPSRSRCRPTRRLALHRKALAALARSARRCAGPRPARPPRRGGGRRRSGAALRARGRRARRVARGASRGRRPVRAGAAVRRRASRPAAQAELLERRSRECYLTGAVRRSDRRAQAGARVPPAGRRPSQGGRLAACAVRPLWCSSAERSEAEDAAARGGGSPRGAAAGARARRGLLRSSPAVHGARGPGGHARLGHAGARACGAPRMTTRSASTPSRTSARPSLLGVEGGREKLERSLELAQEAGLEERRRRRSPPRLRCRLQLVRTPSPSPTSTRASSTAASTTWRAVGRI